MLRRSLIMAVLGLSVVGCGDDAPVDTGPPDTAVDTGAAASICPPTTGGPGAYTDVAVTDPDVEAAAAFAVAEISGAAGTPFTILCAQRQVVAGLNHRMGLEIGGVDYLVVVFEDLGGAYTLVSSTVLP